MASLLVVGAGGQLGREILGLAPLRGHAATGLVRADLDITDATAVARAVARHAPQLVVNAAAYTAVDKAESEPEVAAAGNVTGPAVLAAAAARAGVPLLHVSTDYVFDGSKVGPYVEDDPIAPLGVYGRTKADGEARVRALAPRHVIVRTAWVYGAYGNNFLKTMLRLARERDSLRVVGDQWGCPTATADIADAVFAVAERGAEAVWGTYHFAGTGRTSWHGFADEIVALQAPFTGRKPPVAAIATADYPTPARRPANSDLASISFAATFGLRAAPWQERARGTVEALLGCGGVTQ